MSKMVALSTLAYGCGVDNIEEHCKRSLTTSGS
jgi:hypothetical protein